MYLNGMKNNINVAIIRTNTAKYDSQGIVKLKTLNHK